MFKKFILAALVAAPMMLSAQSAVKFGMVNPAEIFQVMSETATAQNTLKAASDKYQQQGKALQDELQKKSQELEELEKAKAAQATIEAKTKEAQDLYTRLQNFSQTAQQDLQKQQETLMAPIQQKLQNAIQAVGAKGGYTAILDSATLLYKGNSMEDVSAKVKAELGIK